jgi:regulation of enolase protein 1 (concanavalin A-like superfamily)
MIMKKLTKLLSLGLCCCAAACSNPSQKASDPDFTDNVSEALAADGKIDFANLKWTREPASYTVEEDRITITTAPHTDLWQRTYYHFRNDNAPVFQMQTKEQYFSFTVKTDFTQSHHRFDQCGIVMYLDSDNWLKGSVEYENEDFQHLGSVVTNNGYSDWATTAIPADVKTMWYRFSRRADDYCIECSSDGENFSQMRICHMYKGADQISFGIYACSPEDSSFTAVFTDMKITECMWKAHDGQQPDAE